MPDNRLAASGNGTAEGMLKKILHGAPAAAFLSLCACGGAGTSAPAPIAAPPPAPAPVVYSTLPLSQAATFSTITSRNVFTGEPGFGFVTFGAAGVSERTDAVTIAYDPSTHSYTLTDGAIGQTLGPADRLVPTGEVYTRTAGNTFDGLTIGGNVAGTSATAPIQLTYLSYGVWSHSQSSGGEKRRTWFLIGFPTVISDLPRTGSASYTSAVTAGGTMVGVQGNGAGTFELSVGGTATFEANFDTGAITTGLVLSHSDLGSEIPVGTFTGTGRIAAGTTQFLGQLTSGDSPFSGTFNGGFFGPQAQEMGYAFFLSGHRPDGIGGTDWRINGTVVGRRN
jgi:hypothetical protein